MATATNDPWTGGQKAVAEAKSVANLKSVDALKKKVDDLKKARASLELQWKLNLAFYKGRQYTYIHKSLNQVRERPSDDGELPRFRVRLVSNQIITGAHSLLAKLTKTKPVMSATPGSASDQDLKAAQMAESLLEYWWEDLSLAEALDEVMLWCIVAGNGYWKINWDEHANKQMKFLLGPDGQPIVNESLKTAYRHQLEQVGVEPMETVVALGDIRVEAMSPFQVYMDPSAKTARDAKYAICLHYLDPEEVYQRWKIRVEPDSVPADEDVSLSMPGQGGSGGSEKTVKKVYIGYFLPSASMPKGRYVVWMEAPDKILQDDPWPYPTNELPIVKFPGLRVPGTVYDSSVVEHAIPMQKELNRTLSQIVEYKNLTIKPRVWSPVGSIRRRITNEPGAVYEFTPVAGMRPEIEQLPAMPPYVFEHLQRISQNLRDVFALQEVTEGTVPPNVEAGIAIDLLQEMATDRLAPTIRLMEKSLAKAGQLMLALAQEYYIEPRLLKIRGSGGSVQVKKFTNADIGGNIAVHVESGSGLPRTRAGRQARIQNYVEMGIIPPEQAYKYLDVADLKGVVARFQLDEDQAQREHEKLIRGTPTNPSAARNAQMSIMQGMNPETGQPLTPDDDPFELMVNAAFSPTPFENSTVHADQHGQFMKSVEFEQLDEEIQQRFFVHQGQTNEKVAAEQPPTPAEAPKVNLGLKGTIGPTGAASILQRAGLQDINPEIMAEPPLETWVTDSMDKPDQDEAGNDPFTQREQAVQAASLMQKAATDTTHSRMDELRNQDKHELDIAAAAQKLAHAEELHQEKLKTAKTQRERPRGNQS